MVQIFVHTFRPLSPEISFTFWVTVKGAGPEASGCPCGHPNWPSTSSVPGYGSHTTAHDLLTLWARAEACYKPLAPSSVHYIQLDSGLPAARQGIKLNSATQLGEPENESKNDFHFRLPLISYSREFTL